MADSEHGERCPRCSSDQIAGLVAAFWHPVGESLIDANVDSNTEMGSERHCGACDHYFEEGDKPEPEPETKPKPKNRRRRDEKTKRQRPR